MITAFRTSRTCTSMHRMLATLPVVLPPCHAFAALPPITDAVGRSITLTAPAERIVLGFNYEEYTAIAGPEGWDRVVGVAETL
jgi:hypothetical protein